MSNSTYCEDHYEQPDWMKEIQVLEKQNKELRELLAKKGKESIEKEKIRKEVEPRQEWNEDDDQYLLVCKNALRKYQASDKWDAEIISRWLENKLKAPQSQWKPSEEQMEALKSSTYCQNEQMSKVLFELYQDLKKL